MRQTGVEKIETNPSDPSDPMSQVPAENAYEKIHFYFDTAEHANLESVSELAAATASVKTDYATALGVAQRRGTDSNINENVYITVQFVSDYMEDETYQTLKAARENAKTADERDEAKTNMNQYSKQYHANLVAENLPTLSAIPYTAFHAIDYSSFVTLTVPAAELDTAVLEEVADQDNILHISLTDGFEIVSESGTYAETNSSKTGWQDVLECINADDYVVEDYEYTGRTIKVGVYEDNSSNMLAEPPFSTSNYCDTSISAISALPSDIVFRDSTDEYYGYQYLTHATVVTTILAKMLPYAEFYFAQIPTEVEGYYLEGISWFISQNCDIVNCSFGCGNLGVYRYDVDALYDYQIESSGTIVVKSAGNAEDGANSYITSPGLAYNVITVGGVGYSSSESGWGHHPRARCAELGSRIKPNVSAPFEMYVPGIVYDPTPNNSSSSDIPVTGTSFASPLVTGCIALFLEKCKLSNQVSMMEPQSIMAIVQATATCTADYQEMTNHDFDEKVGAGIINLERMMDDTNMSAYTKINRIGTSGSIIFEEDEYFIAESSVQISAAWLVKATPGYFDDNIEDDPIEGSVVGTKSVMNYSIYVYDPYGNMVASSVCPDSAVELIRYVPEVSGYHRIVVKQTGNRVCVSPITLSYFYFRYY